VYKFGFVLVLCYFCSCKRDAEIIDQKRILAGDAGVHQMDTVLMDSLTNTLFSRIQKPNAEGMAYTYTLKAPYLEQEIYVIYKGKVRSNFAFSQGALAFVAYDEWGQQLCWWGITLRPHLQYQNEWNTFSDSIHIPALIEKRKYSGIKAYPFLGNSPGEKLDIDSFEITLKKRAEL
jgi:hypothetical protein